VATYNIRKSIGLDRRRRPARTIDVLSEIKADIVAVQEADRRLGARRPVLQEDALYEAAGLRIVPIDGSGISHGWHGNALLVSDRVDVHRIAGLELPSLEPRGAVIADVEVAGLHLRVAGAHLGLRRADRHRQARAIVDELSRLADGKAEIVLGDFNEWRRDSACIQIFGERLDGIRHDASFHTAVPVAPLDRVFHCAQLTRRDSGVHRSRTARRASDHLPLWADLDYAGTPGVEALPEAAD
jgi:endonuclease/exonuclease/phosphatase family metal-dependent hydrolase